MLIQRLVSGLRSIADDVIKCIREHADKLDIVIDYEKDLEYDVFGYKTMEKSYLSRITGEIVERPQQMLMRVAIGIHYPDVDAAIESYNLLSNKKFTHATPTMYNCGYKRTHKCLPASFLR